MNTVLVLSGGGIAGIALIKALRALPACRVLVGDCHAENLASYEAHGYFQLPPLAEIKNQVIEAVKRERAEAQAMERARALASAAKDGDFVAAARAQGFTTGELAFFSRAEPPKERGVPGAAVGVLVEE